MFFGRGFMAFMYAVRIAKMYGGVFYPSILFDVTNQKFQVLNGVVVMHARDVAHIA